MDDSIQPAAPAAPPHPVPSGATPSHALTAAVEYADAGFEVYPVHQTDAYGSKAKAPACLHGYKDATRDPACMTRWWGAGPALGVAIRTGLVAAGPHAGRHLVVIDVDRAKAGGGVDGDEMLRRWSAGEVDGRRHALPETLEQRTWSGGRHLVYVTDKHYRCTANPHLRIDVRCVGGGIVAAPTVIAMADGRRGAYEWVGGFDSARIAEADAEVEALIGLAFSYRGTPLPRRARRLRGSGGRTRGPDASPAAGATTRS